MAHRTGERSLTAIVHVLAREVLDSRGKPTVEAEVHLSGGVVGRAMVPSGASTGAAEAFELRDGDPQRYDGQGVMKAVRHVNEILGPAVVGIAAEDQFAVDTRLLQLDPTPQKERLGANAILAVSLAAAKAAALATQVPLYKHFELLLDQAAQRRGVRLPTRPLRIPMPMVNMISGGKHAGGNLDFQDVLIIPRGAASFAIGLEWIVRVYRRLGTLLREAGFEGYLVGDEGGYGPRLESNRQAVEFVVQAIQQAGLRAGHDVTLALDVASTHFYHQGHYHLHAEHGRKLSSEEMIDRLETWVNDFPLDCIEDGLAEEDWEGWRLLTLRLGARVKLVGDDLFATNEARLRRGVELQAANAVLIKVNQIGDLTETFHTILTAQAAGYATIISARSGETEDDLLADLAVGVGGDYIKIGAITRSERLAKYNRLLRIAESVSPSRT